MRMMQAIAGGHDAPIQTLSDDLLDGQGVARAIHRFLTTSPPSWSTRIGLFGRWGSGKTSILNLLRALEEADGALILSFSAWSASGETGVIEQFYGTLAERLRNEQIELPRAQRTKRLLAKAGKLSWIGNLGRKAAEELSPLPSAVTKTGLAALEKLGSVASAWTKVSAADLEAIARLIQGRRVVVFIDDLDRADPRLIPKTLLAMRELLDWPGFAFVLAFDKRAVSSALSEYSIAFGEDADGFLEKVIDIPFEVPMPSDHHRERLALAALAACCDLMPSSTVVSISPHLPSEPRRVKTVARMMGSLRPSLARHAVDDVDWIGLALYLVLKEANSNVAEWVLSAAVERERDWSAWVADEEGRKRKLEEVRGALTMLLASPKPPDDADRVISTALRLLSHWEQASEETILYWARLVYREPAITKAELLGVIESFATAQSSDLVDEALVVASKNANASQEDAARDLLKTAIYCYTAELDSIASARTVVDLDDRRAAAERSLLLLEHLYSQRRNIPLAAAAAKSSAVVPLIGLVGQWLGWTRTTGEVSIRQRERKLALYAADRCLDPEPVFASTDPFWNENHGQYFELLQNWRNEVRATVGPLVVARVCARFLEVDGMVPVASGHDELGPWLVECAQSPLYTEPTLTAQLLATFRSGTQATRAEKSTLAQNARLFLKQILSQTRDGSWGGPERAKSIHERNPEVFPAAWRAVVDCPAPFRMQESLRKLRTDLISLGVGAQELREPPWMASVQCPPAPDVSASNSLSPSRLTFSIDQ